MANKDRWAAELPDETDDVDHIEEAFLSIPRWRRDKAERDAEMEEVHAAIQGVRAELEAKGIWGLNVHDATRDPDGRITTVIVYKDKTPLILRGQWFYALRSFERYEQGAFYRIEAFEREENRLFAVLAKFGGDTKIWEDVRLLMFLIGTLFVAIPSTGDNPKIDLDVRIALRRAGLLK